jgi:nucleoside triphosphate diphosphatase
MPTASSFDHALALMRDLRVRCDWDAAQTHESLRPYLTEESHEVDEAIRSGDDRLLREELGDLLLQVLFHAVLAEERGAFAAGDVADTLVTKMKGRHPHLYGDGVKEPWERMKAKRRTSIVDGLPVELPPLLRAHRLQERAAGVLFDWPSPAGPLEKVAEELNEVREIVTTHPPSIAPSGAADGGPAHERLTEELGDLLFSCVNLCRKSGVHAAVALDRANAKFARRFQAVEALARDRGLTVGQVPLAVLDGLWDEVKAAEHAAAPAARAASG